MKELITKLRALAFGMALEPIIHQSVVDDISNAADALERLTAGNSEMLPMPFIQTENNLIAWCKDYGDRRAAEAVMALAKPNMSHASPAMQIAGGSVEIDMAGVDAKPGTVGWLTAARVWRAMYDVKSQPCFEEAQPVPQPPSPAEIIALAKSVGAARSEGWGKWTFTYDQLQDFAQKVSHFGHAEDKPPEPIKK